MKVDAHEELIMVLLQRQQVISALKYVRERNIIVSAASFLKAAKATGDDGAPPLLCAIHANFLTTSTAIFYATYKFFESLNESKVVASQSLHDVRRRSSSASACLQLTRACPHVTLLLQESCAEYVKHFNATFRVSDK